jgi:hypothetical protein
MSNRTKKPRLQVAIWTSVMDASAKNRIVNDFARLVADRFMVKINRYKKINYEDIDSEQRINKNYYLATKQERELLYSISTSASTADLEIDPKLAATFPGGGVSIDFIKAIKKRSGGAVQKAQMEWSQFFTRRREKITHTLEIIKKFEVDEIVKNVILPLAVRIGEYACVWDLSRNSMCDFAHYLVEKQMKIIGNMLPDAKTPSDLLQGLQRYLAIPPSQIATISNHKSKGDEYLQYLTFQRIKIEELLLNIAQKLASEEGNVSRPNIL